VLWIRRHGWQFSYEAFQPPLYYLTALPAWLAGRAVGGPIGAVYAVRIFDAVLAALLAPMAMLIALRIWPARNAAGWSAAALTALLPGVALNLTSVTNDVLVSVLGADPGSANRFWRSKGRAERLVAESGLLATIIRTPILLGPGMAAARAVVHAASQRSVTLLGGGRHSVRPLDVDDLSRAIVRCCETPRAGVAIYELVGPEPTTYRDVIARTAALMGRDVAVRSVPIWLAKLGVAIAGWTRRGGMTATVIDVIASNESVQANADVELGVTLTPLSTTLAKLLPSETKVLHT